MRIALLACLATGCTTLGSPADSPIVTTAATLQITPDGNFARTVNREPLSAFVVPVGDGWQLVLSNAPVGTDCTTATVGPGTLTFFIPTIPPLVAPADGSIAQVIDLATDLPIGFDDQPHAGLDLAIATRETVGSLNFFPRDAGFSGSFDATTTGTDGLMHVTGKFDAPICY